VAVKKRNGEVAPKAGDPLQRDGNCDKLTKKEAFA
jgi:hypothetical protein